MNKRENTAAIVDGILRLAAGGTFIASSLVLPGLAIGLDKPFNALMKSLDKRAREREVRRALRYMRQTKLVENQSFDHGITITRKGQERLQKARYNGLRIARPKKWDGHWRLVIFDIPESRKYARDNLSGKLRTLGFQPLQRSVWVHPFPCHEEIEATAVYLKVTRFVTYLETSYIDKPELLKSRFSKIIKL